jgi:Domain of unknown function (DUF4190)
MSYQPSTPRTTNALAVVSLIFGIGSWCVLPILGAIVAVVCGHLARADIRRAPASTIEGDGMAVAGLVLGYAQLAFALLLVLLVFGSLLLGVGIAAHFLHGQW